MAGEIQFAGTTGQAIKARITDAAGLMWNGAAMVATSTMTDAEWTAALVACTEEDTSEAAGSGLYIADWPGALTQSAVYGVSFYAGAAPTPGSLLQGVQEDATDYNGTQLAAIQADLPNTITKNVALADFPFFMALSSDDITGGTGLTVTPQRSIDGAAFGNCANAVAEIGVGVYKIDLAATDLNGDTIMLKFTANTANATLITIVTKPT